MAQSTSLYDDIYQGDKVAPLAQLNNCQVSSNLPVLDNRFGGMSNVEAKYAETVTAEQQAGNPETSENSVCNGLRQCAPDSQADETHDETKQTVPSSPKVRVGKVQTKAAKSSTTKKISEEVNDKRSKADPCLKKILRAFRKEIKD